MQNPTKKIPVKFAVTLFFLVPGGVFAAEEKLFNATLSASHLWDSNFFRDPEEIPEEITLLTAGVGLSTNLSRQKFTLGWRARSYQHAENEQFDETIQDGVARWNGAWAGQFTSNLEWVRSSYLVDRWEAPENDAVTKDDAKFTLTHGSENRFSFHAGGRQSKQTHTSWLQNNLNYEENEVFGGFTYKTPSNSTLTVRYRDGDRVYTNRLLEDPDGNFDFDYRQVEVENLWRISSKTSSSITLARFERVGVVNNSIGDLAVIDFTWDATPKLQWHGGYSYSRPVQGETIDRPTKVQTGFVGVAWDLSSKISLASRVEHVRRDYEDANEILIRTETQYNIVPLALTYVLNESFSLKLDTSWRKNESPVYERQYESTVASLGVTFRF